MSNWKPAVKTTGSPIWSYNGLVFATHKEAHEWAYGLMMRWMAVEEYDAHESDDPVTHRLVEGTAVRIGDGA